MSNWIRRKSKQPTLAESEPASAVLEAKGLQSDSEGRRDVDPARVNHSYGLLAVSLFIGYMTLAAGLYVWRGVYFSPDRWAILLFIAALALGRWKAFLHDWIPVVLLIFGYEFMRGLAYQFIEDRDRTVHLHELITADRTMFFGHLPTLWLQQKLYVPGTIHWYDVLAMVMYIMHFVFPLMFAFILWIANKDRFWNFTLTLLLMTYVGFTIYLFYPAAPPWLANQWGVIHGVQLPFDQVYHALVPHEYDNLNMVQIWGAASGNPVAAMPSLHAAYPWLTMLFALKFFGKRGLIFLPYNAALWFAVVYLGQHWVIDILAGIALATASFVVMQLAWPRIQRSRLHQVPERASDWVRAAAARLVRPGEQQ